MSGTWRTWLHRTTVVAKRRSLMRRTTVVGFPRNRCGVGLKVSRSTVFQTCPPTSCRRARPPDFFPGLGFATLPGVAAPSPMYTHGLGQGSSCTDASPPLTLRPRSMQAQTHHYHCLQSSSISQASMAATSSAMPSEHAGGSLVNIDTSQRSGGLVLDSSQQVPLLDLVKKPLPLPRRLPLSSDRVLPHSAILRRSWISPIPMATR